MLAHASHATTTTPLPHPPPCGRAIACGNFGFESCVRERGWIPKLRARPDFDSDVAPVRRKLATCDCPAPCGEGADRVRGPDLHNDEVIAACSPQLERGQSREREHDRD